MDFNFKNFVRECYLRSVPSVDLDNVTAENPVNCSDHKLLCSEYDKILAEFVPEGNDNLIFGCNMWMVQSGPQLVNG